MRNQERNGSRKAVHATAKKDESCPRPSSNSSIGGYANLTYGAPSRVAHANSELTTRVKKYDGCLLMVRSRVFSLRSVVPSECQMRWRTVVGVARDVLSEARLDHDRFRA